MKFYYIARKEEPNQIVYGGNRLAFYQSLGAAKTMFKSLQRLYKNTELVLLEVESEPKEVIINERK